MTGQDRGLRPDVARRCGPLIGVGEFYVVEALGHAWLPFAGSRPDHRAGVELTAIDPHRAAAAAGLAEPQASFYELRDEVKNLLARWFPNPDDEAKVTEMFVASVADDRLGIPVCPDSDRLEYACPVAILAARRN